MKMSAEKQYIELYERFASLIDVKSAPVLNAQRTEAISVFKKMGFPKTFFLNWMKIINIQIFRRLILLIMD